MDGGWMKEQEKEKRSRVMDPVSRISEIIFGVLMALSFSVKNHSMNVKKVYRKATLLTFLALAVGFSIACASAPRMVPTISETASQWNTDVDRHIPDA
jgi:hypothetical protein